MLALFSVLVLTASAQVANFFSTTQTADATYYAQTTINTGACTLDKPTWPNLWATVAIANPSWYGSASCGMCLQFTGDGTGSGADPVPTSPTLVYVTDLCPGCPGANLDLSFVAQRDGQWGIHWIAVPCPVVGSVTFVFQGSNPYYIKLQARNTMYPVQSLRFRSGTVWYTSTRVGDNFFERNGITSALTFPIDVEVTSIFGEVITTSIPSLVNDQEITPTTSVQFSIGQSSSSSSSSSSSPSSSPMSSSSSSSSSSGPPQSGASYQQVCLWNLMLILLFTVILA